VVFNNYLTIKVQFIFEKQEYVHSTTELLDIPTRFTPSTNKYPLQAYL